MTPIDGPQHIRDERVVATSATMQPMVVGPDVVTEPRVVVESPPVVGAQVSRSVVSGFEPDAFIAAGIGLVLLIVGLIAIARGGFDGGLSDPVFEVLGFAHTTALGLVEIGFGLVLLLSGATRSRSGEVVGGLALAVAGFVGAVQTSSFVGRFALESSMAWLAWAAGVVVVVAALALPRFTRRSTIVEQR